MGFLKKFKKVVKKVGKTVVSPTKLTTAVLTGGVSVVAPKLTAPISKAVKSTLFNPQLALAVASRGTLGSPGLNQGGSMAFNVGGFLGSVGTILGQSNISSLKTAGAVANIGAASIAAGKGAPKGMTVMATKPLIQSGLAPRLAAGAVVARGFFNKYPNLATAIQKFRNAGISVKRSQLYGMLRRFGPEIMISGGILTAAAVSELMMAGPGRRRMNPANVRALRRSMRRLDSFHRLCVSTDKLRRPRGRSCKTRSGAQQFVRQG